MSLIDPAIIINGIIIGLVIAAPLGPVNLICIQRTLHYGRIDGLTCGAGAAVGDALLALIAALGVTAALDFAEEHEQVLRLVAGLFLVAFGFYVFYRRPAAISLAAHTKGMQRAQDQAAHAATGRAAVAVFLLTITNPGTLLGLTIILGSITGLSFDDMGPVDAPVFTLAVFTGSSLWLFGLSSFVNLFRGGMTDGRLVLVNRVMGTLLAGAGIIVLLRTIITFDAP